MNRNFTSKLQQTGKFAAVTLFVILASLTVNAQRRHADTGLTYGGGGYGGTSEWGIQVMGGYDIPQGNLGFTFNSAPAFGFGVIRNWHGFTFNATLGYTSYKPKYDTLYFNGTDAGNGYEHYGSFSSLEIFTGAAYNIQVSDGAKFYAGMNLGAYYNHLNDEINDGSGTVISSDGFGEAEYIAPKLGINFSLSDNIMLGLEARYNLTFQSASGSGDAFDYGYATTVDRSITGNAVLTIGF